MINCNPETVSTDYDTSDRLYFEPLTLEDVFAVCEHEASAGAPVGVIVQFGGQTPLNLSLPLKAAGVTIIGTSPESIDLAEDRKRFGKLLDELEIPQARARWRPRSKKRSQARSESAIPCWCGLPTCSADARWSSPTTKRRSSAT